MTRGKVLIVGRSGQLAHALADLQQVSGYEITCAARPECDLVQSDTLQRTIDHVEPRMVINAAAYTAVDQAENDTEAAFAVNAEGVGALGKICARHKIPMVHVSTDYVFDGSADQPYAPDDPVAPQGVYGKSKAAGEAALREALDQHLILRTAWVFSAGGRNFFTTMINAGTTRAELRVVDDQHGTPTYAADLARGICEIAAQALYKTDQAIWGTYHLTNTGATTWCGFAREIFACQARAGGRVPEVTAITTADYPTPAKRPAWSVLDCSKTESTFGVRLPDWKDATARCVAELMSKD